MLVLPAIVGASGWISSWSLAELQGQSGNGTSYTFNGVNFGSANADRFIYVSAAGREQATPSGTGWTSCTIGGVTAEAVIDNYSARSESARWCHQKIWRAAVPSGTSGQVIVNAGNQMEECALVACRAIQSRKIRTRTRTDGDDNNPVATLTNVIPPGSGQTVYFGVVTNHFEVQDDYINATELGSVLGQDQRGSTAVFSGVQGDAVTLTASVNENSAILTEVKLG